MEQKNILYNSIILLNVKDIHELTGWCETTIRNLCKNDETFPVKKIGEGYQIELQAFKDWWKTRQI